MTHIDDPARFHHTESAEMPKKTKSGTKSAGKKRGKSKSAGSKKKGGKKSGKRSAKLSAKSSASKIEKEPVDMLHPAVMENLYYIAHDAPDALSMRGFGWPDAPKKKGKGKKGKKKKK